MEMELSLQYPHLTNPYWLLATVLLPEITNDLVSIVREHTTIKIMEKDLTNSAIASASTYGIAETIGTALMFTEALRHHHLYLDGFYRI